MHSNLHTFRLLSKNQLWLILNKLQQFYDVD